MEENPSLFSLSIDSLTKAQLVEVAKWARVFAFAGIVLLLILLASNLYTSNAFVRFGRSAGDEESGIAYSLGVVLGSLLIFLIPLFALVFILRFAAALNKALEADNQQALHASFRILKIYFRYLGILTVASLAVAVLAFVLRLAGSAV